MPLTGALRRPRVSRDTRRLLGVAAVALLTLWALARLRFPDAPVAPNPVPPLLAQLAPPARFAELAAELDAVRDRMTDQVFVLASSAADPMTPQLALRARPGRAATVLTREAIARRGADTVAVDPATGLALVATTAGDAGALPRAWQPPQLPAAQFFIAASATSRGAFAVHPVFVSSWSTRYSPAWNAELWVPDADGPLAPGTFVFTLGSELAGVAVDDGETIGIVPAPALYSAIETLATTPAGAGTGWLGLTGTTVTRQLAGAVGVDGGVLVLDVEAQGPADGVIAPGDVITGVNERDVRDLGAWSAVVDRLRPGQSVRVRLAAGEGTRDVALTAQARPVVTAPAFGLRLRRVGGRTEIVAVQRGSIAADAGLRAGDVLVKAGSVISPTAADIRRLFAAHSGEPLLVLYARDGVTHATALE